LSALSSFSPFRSFWKTKKSSYHLFKVNFYKKKN
jgi:hypothetical protein